MSMNTLFLYILPIVLTILVLLVPKLRQFLELRAELLKEQQMMIESFQDNAARFLRLADGEEFADLRHILCSAGNRMNDGSSLVEKFINAGKNSGEPDPELDKAFSALPEEAQVVLGRALALSLLHSAYNSLYWRRYVNILAYILDLKTKEVNEPVQVVHSFARSKSQLNGFNKAAA